MAEVTNQQSISVTPQPVFIGQQQVPPNVTSLRGSQPRYNMGCLIIACGVVQVILAVAILCFPSSYCSGLDRVCWGIWNGVFAIITGSLGVYSREKKSMVISFMVLAIIATAMSATCCGFQAATTVWCGYYDIGIKHAIYIIICLTYALEFIFCIIGASFTCVALGCNENQIQQVIVYQPYTVPPVESNVATPYTGIVNMAAQQAPFNMIPTNGAPPPYQFVTAQPVSMPMTN